MNWLSKKNNKSENIDILNAEYAMEFARGLAQYNNYISNPLTANQFLKNINMNPNFQNKEAVENMAYNPKENELGLRRVSQHLYNTQMPYKRLIHYFSDMLKFEISIHPTNINPDDLKDTKAKDRFMREYDKVWEWLDSFDYKQEFKRILLGTMLEDAKFSYLRTDGNKLTLQEMPTDYCIIDAWSEIGWLYSFNLLYFQQIGSDINGYAPEFKKMYNRALEAAKNKTYIQNVKIEQRNGKWFYWQQMNPENGWVFKFDYAFAGLVPPFLGIFTDAVDLDAYKKMYKDKTTLEAYKMIAGTVPRNKDNKSGNARDDFAIQANTLAQFMQLVKNDLPPGLLFKALPLDNLQSFNFENSSSNQNKDLVGTALKNYYKQAGADQALFNAEKPNASSMKASTRIDAAFMEVVYPQFETFLNYHINNNSKKIKWKVKLSGTIFDEQERFDNAMTKLSSGIITPDIPAELGMTERDMRVGLGMMAMLGYPELFKPIQNSFNMPTNTAGAGRPASKEPTDSKEITDDAGSNDNKAVE